MGKLKDRGLLDAAYKRIHELESQLGVGPDSELEERIGITRAALSGTARGGSLVRVNGSFLADYGGLHCTFGAQPAVAATWVNAATLLCEAPPLPPSERNNSRGYGFDAVAVEVTINGQLWASTAAGAAAFTYAWDDAVRVSSTYPAGAPRGGGTPITLRGAGFRDLGGARPGVFCKFGGADDLVPAEGSGEDEIVCTSPPLPDVENGAACAAAVTIEVTINGDNPANGAAMYAGDDGARFQIGDVEGVA